jgi:hypothetical protein
VIYRIDLLLSVISRKLITLMSFVLRPSLVCPSVNSTTELSDSGLLFNNQSYTRVFPRNNGLLLSRYISIFLLLPHVVALISETVQPKLQDTRYMTPVVLEVEAENNERAYYDNIEVERKK